LLEEIGKPYDVVPIAREDRRSREHLARHPLGRVPVVELDDGTYLFESAAICLQLADLYPDAGLIPPVGSQERGIVYQWVLFAMTELEGPLFRWRREMRDNPSDTPPSRERFADAATGCRKRDRCWPVAARRRPHRGRHHLPQHPQWRTLIRAPQRLARTTGIRGARSSTASLCRLTSTLALHVPD
jgi:glutathione S-transferase